MIRVRLPHPIDDHADDQIVRHERATIHILSRGLAQLGVSGAMRAQQVAAGNVRHAIAVRYSACLGALTCTDWAQQHQVQRGRTIGQ